MKIKDFFNWNSNNSKEAVDSILNYLSTDNPQIRIAWKNIYGDEEACELEEWSNQARSTNNTNDITLIIIYDGVDTKFVRIGPMEIRINDKVIKLNKSHISQILNKMIKLKTPEQQRDENNINQMEQFITKFDIKDDDIFDVEVQMYMDTTLMSKSQFIQYLNTIKQSLVNFKNPTTIKYLSIVDRMINVSNKN